MTMLRILHFTNLLPALLIAVSALLFYLPASGQGISCPAVIAGPDTTLACGGCVQLQAQPVSGFETTDYTAQQIPYNPYPYSSGTSILLNIDDTWSSVLPIGFDFCFYGNTYNSLVIGSNGLITFDLTQANGYCQWPINDPIPSVNNPMNSIMGPFHDIDPSVAGVVRWDTYGTAPCRVFVINFDNIALFSCNSQIATQQIVLYETTNVIETYIQSKPTCATWNSGAAIHGIQNATGTMATVVPGRNYPTNWTATNDAWAFVPAGNQNYTITWYENGNVIANTDTVTVCPSGAQDYICEVVYTNCNNQTVTVTDTASIIAGSGTFNVTTSGTDPLCSGSSDGTATANATGTTAPVNYAWNTTPSQSTATATGLVAGTYEVTVTDGSGCSVVQQVTISDPPAMSLTTSSTDLLCFGDANGTATVNVFGGQGPFTYTWDFGIGAPTETGLSGGNYSVTVTDINNCPATANFVINEPALLTTTISSTDVTCNGQANGTVDIVPTGGTGTYSYAWSPVGFGSGLVNLGAGTYSVTVSDDNGCTATNSATIIDPDPLELTISGDDELCRGETTDLVSNIVGGIAPYNYQWVSIPNSVNAQTSEISHAPANDVQYILTVVDAAGCQIHNTFDVLVHPVPVIDFTPSLREGCDTLTVDFTNNTTDADQYTWNFGDNSTSNTSDPSHTFTTGLFTVELTASNQWGCTATDEEFQLIQVIPTPIASFVTDPEITDDIFCLSEAALQFNSTSIYANSANWDFGNGDTYAGGAIYYTYPEAGDFLISMVAGNMFGCTDTARSLIRIMPDPYLYVPSAFTPDGNQVNDEFRPVGTEIVQFHIMIYDRYGKLIFESNSLENAWNGNFDGQPAQEGVYIWRIDATVNKGDKIDRKGTVTLYR